MPTHRAMRSIYTQNCAARGAARILLTKFKVISQWWVDAPYTVLKIVVLTEIASYSVSNSMQVEIYEQYMNKILNVN